MTEHNLKVHPLDKISVENSIQELILVFYLKDQPLH